MTVTRSGTRLEISTLHGLEDFDELRPEWNELVRAMPRPSPFLLHEWLSTWWRWWQHYGERAELSVHVARRGGRLVGAAPLLIRPYLGLRVARFIGGSESAGALADLLLAPDEVPDVIGGLARQIKSSGLDLLDLYGLPARSRIATAFGPAIEVVERVEAPVLDLTPGWDAVYQAKTSSKKRSLHRRRRRQLASLGRLEVEVARTRPDLASALDEAFRLHALRWAGRPDGSGFVTPLGSRFHRAAIDLLAELDVPRIVLLKLDGRAIAFHYDLVLEGRMYVHRLGFDPALARFSPGLVNTLDAIDAAAAEGVTRVEFLGGAERYKVELADGFEPLCHGLGLASGVRARALVSARLGLIRLRLRLKQSPALHRLYLDGLAPVRRVAIRSREALRA